MANYKDIPLECCPFCSSDWVLLNEDTGNKYCKNCDCTYLAVQVKKGKEE